MIKLLSSMRFAFWLLLSIIIWLFIGAMLTIHDNFYYAIKEMGNELILDWILEKSSNSPTVLIWFIGLCLIGFLLAVSFIFCTWYNLLKVARKQASLKSILLFIIHILFVIIMALHLGSMLLGYKYSDVELAVGQEFKFDEGYSIKLNKVHYIDDINVLKMKYKEMRKYHTRNGFHYKDNYAQLTLKQNDKEIKSEKTSMLSPFKYGCLRATISYFYLPKGSESDTPGIKLVIAKNYFNELFFIFYALEIISILIFLLITWKKK
ncbi:MAG: hypothetical protein JEY96_03865 [Bacteroidales bacterium]|nr:hypothetical protein [Bacteroidales bacterium]